jgi:glyoxalase/bleomycin resistance protein/dioxygenase superfamily protein
VQMADSLADDTLPPLHLFSHDLDRTVAWYRRAFDAEVYCDGNFGGSRNVFLKIGTGRFHFTHNRRPIMAEAPSTIGIRTNDLAGLGDRLLQMGVRFMSGIYEFGTWRYVMALHQTTYSSSFSKFMLPRCLGDSRATSTTLRAASTARGPVFHLQSGYRWQRMNSDTVNAPV